MSVNVPKDAKEDKQGLVSRLKQGLSKTRVKFSENLLDVFLGAKSLDEDLLEEVEAIMLSADVGVGVTNEILHELTEKMSRKQLEDPKALVVQLKEQLRELLKPVEQPLVIASQRPFVILMVGVNGVGKTTTIGKLTKRLESEGYSVMLAAGDTFRAAAVEQLQAWGELNDVPVVSQGTGADSASVIFDALSAARARDVDVLIADTAGRLQNKKNLMEELTKINRVLAKQDASAPHEIVLVIDATIGQNSISQAREFLDAVNVTSLTITKLDGTAKGGAIFPIARQLGLPIRFIGVGEQIEDLRPFSADEFVRALFEK